MSLPRRFNGSRQSAQFKDWLRKLRDRRARTIIVDRIARLVRDGIGDTKYLGAKVEELRVSFGPGYRIYFSVVEGAVVFLLLGGDKGSQTRDIVDAQRLAAQLHDD